MGTQRRAQGFIFHLTLGLCDLGQVTFLICIMDLTGSKGLPCFINSKVYKGHPGPHLCHQPLWLLREQKEVQCWGFHKKAQAFHPVSTCIGESLHLALGEET